MTKKINISENTITHTIGMLISMFFTSIRITLWGNL